MKNKINKDLSILFFVGLLISTYILIAYGVLSNPVENDVVHRLNDFINYAIHGYNLDRYIHPMYEKLVHSNFTLAPKLAIYMLSLGFERILIESLITGLFLLIQNLGAPLLTYALTKNKIISILVMISLLFLAGNNEPIYGFITTGTNTGNIIASLLLLELALAVLKRYYVFTTVIFFHLFLHPTTALLWLPLPIAVACISFTKKCCWLKYLQGMTLSLSLFLYPIFIGLTLHASEVYFKLFNEENISSFWEIATVSFYHTKFSNNDKFTNLFTYLCEIISLILILRSKYLTLYEKFIVQNTASLGLGIFIISLILVESESSVLFAMTLPLRFSTVLYALIIIVFVKIASTKKDSSSYIAILFLSTLFFNKFSPLFYDYFKPMWICPLAIILYLRLSCQLSWKKSIFYFITIFIIMIVFYNLIPITSLGNPKSQIIMQIYQSTYLWALNVHPKILSSGILYIVNNFLYISLIIPFYYLNKFLDVKKYALLLLSSMIILSVYSVKEQNIGFKNFTKNLIYIGKEENNGTVSLVNWIKENLDPKDKILSEPKLQLRRVVQNHVSVDLDLLSLLPYSPLYSNYLNSELMETYCIDIHEFYIKRNFINSKVFDNQVWTCAKKSALINKNFDYIVEYAERPISLQPVVFENKEYRVYRVIK